MIDRLIAESVAFENDAVRAWKAEGKPIVGYSCVVTPVEIMEAAGVLPYRLRALGNSKTDLADAHLSRFNCSFCRSLLQLGLDGTYDFLDGLVETNGCDHLRGMFENWQYAKGVPFMHYVKAPHQVTPDSIDYFTVELREFAAALTERFGREITDDALRERMVVQDRIRRKLKRLYEMRERERPAFTGTEVMAIVLAGSTMPAETFEPLLDQTLSARDACAMDAGRARLMLCGAATDEVEFVRGIESVGAMLVTDALCYGSRAFWDWKVDDGADPYDTLSHLYMDNLLCPRMFDDYDSRREFVLAAVDRAKVDGVIVVHNKFCDIHGADNVALRIDLEKRGVPVLSIEKEYGAQADLGRMKTRVQAFCERIGGRS